MALKIGILSLYAVVILIVGVLGLRRTRTFKDFFLGGGNVGPWMTAFTYGTAYFSAVLFIGFAGKVGWGFGYSALWIALGNSLIGVLGVWWLMGYRIKKMSIDYQVHTMPEFFEKRFQSRFLKLFSAVCIFVFFIPYSATVFMGLSYLFISNFQVDYSVALILMGLFTALYLVLGGYKSMSMIDVVFGIIMCVGVVILFSSTVQKGGGLANMTEALTAIHPRLTKPVGPPGFWPLFSLVFLTSVAPFAMPQLVQKFYAIKDKKSVRIGMISSTVFALMVTGVAYFTGATTRIFLSPETTPHAFNNGIPVADALMPELIAHVIPAGLSILILLLILAASKSTLAALVLISSSSVSKDVYSGFINKRATDKKLMLLMRISSGFFVLLSVILAYFKPASIVAILGISWGAIGSGFLGPFIWGLFSRWANRFGAIGSSLLGLGTCVVLALSGSSSPEAGTIGMMVSLVMCPVLSLAVKDKVTKMN